MNISPRIGYVVTFLLPLLYQSLPNPIGLRWYWRHGDAPMPPELERRAVMASTIIPVFQLVALVAVLWFVLSRHSLRDALRWDPERSGWMALSGAVAGCGWLMIYAAIFARVRPSKHMLARHQFMQRSPAFWIPVSMTAAVFEEIWRAVCLTGLSSVGRVHAIALTSVAFGLAHAQPLGRAVSAAACAVYLGVLFFWTRSVMAPIVAHAVINLGTILLVRIAHHRADASALPRP